MHDAIPFDYPKMVSLQFGSFYRYLLPKLGSRVAWVTTVSEFSRQRLQALGIVGENVSVVYPGVRQDLADASTSEVELAARELNLPTRRFVLSLCTLSPIKNQRRLLDAWRLLATHLPSDLWLVLAGGPGARGVHAAAGWDALPPRSLITGYVPERLLRGLYGGAQAFAFPSLYEGFGFPPLEAMSAGIPVLIGNRAAMPEVAGDAALQVDPEDTHAIAASLERLLSDEELRHQLHLAGPERARRFTWERCAQQMAAVLMQVANT